MEALAEVGNGGGPVCRSRHSRSAPLISYTE